MMMFDRKEVFDGLRRFAGALDDVQVSVIAEVLNESERRLLDVRHLAYMLATAWHECRWRPVRETGRGKGKPYGKAINGHAYYGRGLVQLTWIENYRKMSLVTGTDLVADPDAALIVPVAIKIMFYGMMNGSFTGKKLSDYFSVSVDDPVNARRIVNGTDRAKLIAGHHGLILGVLKAARLNGPGKQPPLADAPPVEAKVPPKGKTAAVVEGAGVAGAVVITGGAAVAHGFDWLHVAMIGGVVLMLGVIGYLLVQLRRDT
jgi:putative chitinase